MIHATWRFLIIALLLTFAVRSAPGRAGSDEAAAISFLTSRLENFTASAPTALAFGPDERLYVLELGGTIHALGIERSERNRYRVVAHETIDLIRALPNHNDDGTPHAGVGRQATGLVTAGTPAEPILYVTSSDYREAYNIYLDTYKLDNVDTNSGVVSRLTRRDGTWQRTDLVRGLPRSTSNHGTNGMALDEAANVLYVAQGGMTNMGTPIGFVRSYPEYALSAAILSVDLDAIGETPYDLPTLDDPARPGHPDSGDPFGGNGGANQALVTPDSPVQIFAPGYRNVYDLELTAAGLWGVDNNPNPGWGGPPQACNNAVSDAPVPLVPGGVFLIREGAYGGFPNPTRASRANTFAGHSPVISDDPRQCHYLRPGAAGALAEIDFPGQGIAAYQASSFGGALRGDLLVTGWERNTVVRFDLNDTQTGLVGSSVLFANFGRQPLAITTQADDAPFPGTVWVTLVGENAVQVFEPASSEWQTSSSDTDGDGYTDTDERNAGTSETSAASLPTDSDADFVSNATDPDDDNDGLSDTVDPYALDAANGAATRLPLRLTWQAGSPGTGLLGTGFTGLMTDGETDYRLLFSPDNLINGGAEGKLTIAQVGSGDALTGAPQREAFQVGVPAAAPFSVRGRVVAPFFNGSHAEFQSQGVFVGTGDSDHYVKLVISGSVVQALMEAGAAPPLAGYLTLDVQAQPYVDLVLNVDPARGLVQAAIETVDGQSSLGELFMPDWLGTAPTLAAGIIATSTNAQPFAANWDTFEVVPLAQGVSVDVQALATPAPLMPDTPAAPASAATAFAPQDWCWLPGASSPVARYESAGVVADGSLYVIGGFSGDNLTVIDRVDRYDPDSDTWVPRAPLPLPLTHINAVHDPHTHTVWIAGGYDAGGQPRSETWRYDIAADQWQPSAPLPVPRASGALARVGRTLHYLGGLVDRDRGTLDHWTLDLSNPDTGWTQIATPLPIAANHTSVAVLDAQLYLVGGQENHDTAPSELRRLHRFDPQSETWTTLTDLPQTVSHNEASTFVVDGLLYVLGGRSHSQGVSATRDILRYDPAANAWTRTGTLPLPRIGAVALPIDEAGHVVLTTGGLNWNQPAAETWIGQRCWSDADNPAVFVDVTGATAPPDAVAYAHIVTYGEHSSTFGSFSFQLANLNTDQRIASVTFDIAPALLAGVRFDTDGTLGDVLGKPFTLDEQTGDGVGLLGSTVTLTALTLRFDDFEAGERLSFSIDVDPQGIQGTQPPGPGDSGGVSGSELTGTRVTVEYEDGRQAGARLLWLTPDEVSGDGSAAYLYPIDAPVRLPLLTQRESVDTDMLALRVQGDPLSAVEVIIADSYWYSAEPPPTPDAAQAIEALREHVVLLDTNGVGDISIAAEPGVIYRLLAVQRSAAGRAVGVSPPLTLVAAG